MDNFFNKWEACLESGHCQTKCSVNWPPSSQNVLKFNVDNSASGKSILVAVGSVLMNYKGDVLFMFSKQVGIKKI